jgi:hypothetical protein
MESLDPQSTCEGDPSLRLKKGSAQDDRRCRLLMAKEKKARAAAAGVGLSGKGAADKFAVKRRYPRFGLDTRLQVRMFQDGEYRTCWGRSTEIGQDGIGATLTGGLTTGEIVTLEIPLPLTPYPIKLRAIVRFCQGLRYGFEFLTMNESQRDTVQRVCEYLATR